ncbi:MAG TPA: sigma-54 dependent transcriptional regulator [Phycisphaerae bacterium]|nr:sigma-54 dependent transcriptional regulator [Phycisphaerae bacterium]HRY68007.1 sigma-54 dependent transcriptional regulator [Phycisphaerae bacterium]HSA26744.1 sigma-54 dependent transcriptional regulator [Phycisphaerae bacterium]
MSENTKGVVLVVDDEPLKRITLQIELSQAGYTVLDATDAESALRHLQARPVDVVVTDVRMPQMDGLQFLEQIKVHWPHTHVILMTAYGTVDAAVTAIKRGAQDYLTKPFATEVLIRKLDGLRAAGVLGRAAEAQPAGGEQAGPLIGYSYAGAQLCRQVRELTGNDCAVLLQGETGTGKSLVAQTVHQLSRRAQKPFLVLDCDLCPAPKLEMDLPAKFEEAAGGTLFLQNVDTLPSEIQGRLLYLVDRMQTPQGGELDVRLICATGCDLKSLVDSGGFRKDLAYRISTVTVTVPPLRDRREDIVPLSEEYLRNRAQRTGGQTLRLAAQATEAMLAYHWPGNIRELEHVLERAAALTSGGQIELRDVLLPEESARLTSTSAAADAVRPPALTETIADIERTLIDSALQRAAGNQARAAQILGIPRTTLRDKMTKYGMVGTSQGKNDLGT